jgi:predicted aldo/keto reductase-like oxidoreductase
MYYNDFKGLKISALGFGAMRLPVIDGDDAKIDVEQTNRMVDYAMEHGVNYYDTAWGYHGENSETVMGEALSRYPRDSYYIATKFPGYDLSNMGKVEEIFEKQLEKCKVDYFDFYLIHNVCEMNIDAYLNEEKFGTVGYLLEQKKKGRIKHLGFSFHAIKPNLERFLEKFGEYMEFAQMQLNYFDWKFQKAEEIVELLNEKDIPIWVMEPMRGGKLAKLDDAYAEKLKALRPDEEVPAWAFRFLQGIPNVVVTLAGLTDFEMTKANIATYEEAKPLNDEEKQALVEIVDGMLKETTVPCTACRYCTSHCPQELDIPRLLQLYNQSTITKGDFIAPMTFAAMPKDKKPSACIACKKCEEVCPQKIKISEIFADFAAKRRWA